MVAVASLAVVMAVSVASAALPLPLLEPTLSRTFLVPQAGASEKPSSPKTQMPGNVARALLIPPTPSLAVMAAVGITTTVPVTIALLLHHGRMAPLLDSHGPRKRVQTNPSPRRKMTVAGEECLRLLRTRMRMMEDGVARLFLCLPAVKGMMADGEATRVTSMVNGPVGRRRLPKPSLHDSNLSPLLILSLKLVDGM